MAGRIGWFLIGFLSGVAAISLIKHCQQEEEQDFESIADELSKRFSDLESGAKA